MSDKKLAKEMVGRIIAGLAAPIVNDASCQVDFDQPLRLTVDPRLQELMLELEYEAAQRRTR